MAKIKVGDIVRIRMGGTEGIYRIESLRTTAKRFKMFCYIGVPAFGPKTTGILLSEGDIAYKFTDEEIIELYLKYA